MKIWDKLSEHTQKIAKFVSSVMLLIGLVAGACSWGIDQVMAHMDERVEQLEATVAQTRQDTVRLQLLFLMQNTPDDVENIVKIAKVYFKDLGGDWYMTAVFQGWADAQGVNVSNLLKGVHDEG